MLDHYFGTDENQNKPTSHLSESVYFWPGFFAQQYAEHGRNKSNRSNNNCGYQYPVEQGCKAKSNCQRINTGSYRKQQNNPDVKRIFYFTGFRIEETFNNHFSANQTEQAECNPMVNRFDERFHTITDQPANKRH